MALSRKTVGVIVALLVVSLAGLIVLQSYLLNYAMELKEQAFHRNVLAALNTVVSRLETSKTIINVFRQWDQSGDTGQIQIQMQVLAAGSDSMDTDSTVIFDNRGGPLRFPQVEGRTLRYEVRSPQRVNLQAYDPALGRFVEMLDTFRLPGMFRVELADTELDSSQRIFRLRTDSMAFMIAAQGDSLCRVVPWVQKAGERQALINRVTDRLAVDEWQPIEKRIDAAKLDSLLALTLNEAGIDLEYAYGVISPLEDSLRIVQPPEFAGRLRESEYRARLFPSDLFAARNDLLLYFPARTAYLWRQMGPLFGATFMLLLVIIVCFVLTVRTIIVQRRLAGRMVGFINNMTHEFKTPISTVALACEAIGRPDIIEQKDKIARYNRMIIDENRRMQGQVEKILQMAVLEEGDYELQLTDVDVHEVIRRAVESITLQIEHRGGTITCALDAAEYSVRADAVHLTNIINNLLDNANKYSPQSPVIAVTTHNNDNGITVRISDQGMGIKDEDRKMVFDAYYRVPAGNIHDVKGFGLGLSYVKLMVTAHGGNISLASEYGKGTQVSLWLPLAGGDAR